VARIVSGRERVPVQAGGFSAARCSRSGKDRTIMVAVKSLLLPPLILAGLATPSLAAPPDPMGPAAAPTSPPATKCLAPEAFLTALVEAGDWIVTRDPAGVEDAKLKGVVFRESGMISVALFKKGCLAMVVVVGKAAPDIEV
jgi:hypothetical protein